MSALGDNPERLALSLGHYRGFSGDLSSLVALASGWPSSLGGQSLDTSPLADFTGAGIER